MSSFSPVLGIDLGTTNSVVAVTDGTTTRALPDAEGHLLIPSCVSFPPDGTVVVGHAARERRLTDAANTVWSIKRLIGRPWASDEVERARERVPFGLEPSKTGGVQVRVRKGTYALPEISAMVLRHLRKVAEQTLGCECTRAVITVPANFNELQRSATQAAGRVAGLEVMRVLNEPTAATLAYGYGKERPETVAVYDLGGGTFDITILDLDGDVFEVVSTSGDTFLGGDDVDLALAEDMAADCLRAHRFDPRNDAQAFARLLAAAEWAKCELSISETADLVLEELFEDRAGRPVDFSFRASRDALEARVRPLVARSFDVVAEALRESGRRPKEIDSVVLVGGSTRMPLVRQMVRDFFGGAPRIDIDPDLVVAQGAAIHAWSLAGKPRGSIRPDPASLGKLALRRVTVANEGQRAARSVPSEPRPAGPAFAPDEPFVPPIAASPRPPQRSSAEGRAAPVHGTLSVDVDVPFELDAPAPAARDEFSLDDASFDDVEEVSDDELFEAPQEMSVDDDDDLLRFVPEPAELPPPSANAAAHAALAPRIADLELAAEVVTPLLMDVTPHSLGLEVAGGFCQAIIPRNAPLPAEKSRVFSTGRDDQDGVEVRICQGEGARFVENELLGTLSLSGIRRAARGAVRVEVTFLLDASGILDVRATDLDTGRVQSTRITLQGGLDASEVEAMRARQERELAAG